MEYDDALSATAARYLRGGDRFAGRWVAGKLRHDPVHRAVLELAPDLGTVADIGCGRGQLSILLLLAGRARAVIGIDRNRRHLDQGRRAAAGLAFTPSCADLGSAAEIPACDTAVVVDVLYQLAPDRQYALLREVAAAARQRVLVRTLDPGRGLRSRLAITFERVALLLSPRSDRLVAPLPVADLAGILRAAGFAVSVAPCWQGTPFANVLLTARRL
ncbi:MAG: class I SAM-dependent methyltransferase [Acetobacteraceae bacterium]|nr:class I SAM-dependent methyltransferase [Acetobacteraceae bacterium]